MSRLAGIFLVGALGLGACTNANMTTISSMNYLQEPIDPVCVRTALAGAEGFASKTPIRQRGGAREIDVIFNGDMPITAIVRRLPNGTGEVSVFTRVPKDLDPLQRREAAFAVEAADEVIYRQCTADGKINPGDSDVVIEAQE